MKRCPQCMRDYTDGSLNFCLDDGVALLDGPAIADEPATAVLGAFGAPPSGGGIGIEARTQVFENRPRQPGTLQENKNSIAVLSFKNISADIENEYFCDGLAEELLNALAKIGDLKVAARTSAFSFKGKDTDIGEIGRKLGVATILEGSVRKSGERLRISVQLLNASDGYHIWSETYDRMMQDIFDVQDEITLAVIDALKVKLLGNTKSSLLKRETENTEAYKAYLKGKYLRYTKNDHRGAFLAYEEAVKLDPSHAPSWLGLAESCVLQSHYGLTDPIKACDFASEALANARNIQGESAEALYIDGFAAFVRRDWTACDKAYRRALEIEPGNSRALGTFGVIKSIFGEAEEASVLFERARAADPLAAYPYAMTGAGLVLLRRPEEALAFFEQAFEFERDQTLALWSCCMAHIQLGDFEQGIATAKTAVEVSRRGGFFLGLLGWALAAAGRPDEARLILDEFRDRPADSPVLAFEACLLAELDEKDAAFQLLSRAADEFAPLACYLRLPCYDRLRDDPRFGALAQRMGIPN